MIMMTLAMKLVDKVQCPQAHSIWIIVTVTDPPHKAIIGNNPLLLRHHCAEGKRGRLGRLFLMKQCLIFSSTLSIMHFEVVSSSSPSPPSSTCIGSASVAEDSAAGGGEGRAARKTERWRWAWWREEWIWWRWVGLLVDEGNNCFAMKVAC